MRSYLFQEGVGEGLYSELEGPEVGRLIQTLHLLRHERLMDWLTLGIGSIHCGAQSARGSAIAPLDEDGRRCRRGHRGQAIRTIGTDRIQELKENALDIGPILLRHLISVARRAATLV